MKYSKKSSTLLCEYTVYVLLPQMENEKQRIRGKGDGGRCAKQKSKRVYGKKRKTPNKKGKQRTSKVVEENVVAEAAQNTDINFDVTAVTTTSTKKLQTIETSDILDQAISGFRLVEMSILSKVLSILACPDCKNTNTLSLVEVSNKKIGLSSLLKIECNVCDYFHQFYTSPEISSSPDERRRGKKAMEVNIRVIYGFRNIGIGFSLLSKVCGFLNMPQPMAKDSYDHISNRIKMASKAVAEKSMLNAAVELRNGEKTADVGVSVDGTWQRKGFSSTLGVITAISIDTGKVLDAAILSKSCKGCTKMEKVSKVDPNHFK